MGIDSRLAIPVYRMELRGSMQIPVEEKLKRTPVRIDAGGHVLKILDAPKPHTDRFHQVGWFDTQHDGVGVWDASSWKKLALDTPFLSALALQIARDQKNNPRLNAYMLIGHSSAKWTTEATLHRSLQSVRRGHIHFSERLSGHAAPYRTVNPAKFDDMARTVTYVNIAGRISADTFASMLTDFGSEQSFNQNIGSGDSCVQLKREFFGFSGFGYALDAAVSLREAVKPAWQDHTIYVCGFSAGAGDVYVPVRQLPVPGVSILMPSSEVRDEWGVPDDIEALVQPLTVVGPPNILVPGGAMMKWE